MTHPYQHPLYANAFAYDYEALHLNASNAHVLLRPIADTSYIDAMGVYPLCPINPEADMQQDFAQLQAHGVISLVLVADPFLHPPLEKRQQAFDVSIPFKEHFLCDFSKAYSYSKHHRYETKKALKTCETRLIALQDHLDDWYAMYHTLIEKRGITGIQAFPKSYFAAIAALEPVTVAAFHEGTLVSAHIWFRHGAHAYSHLAASSEAGYRLGAAYAVYDHSIQHLRETGTHIIDLGGGAGNEASAGLTFLKKGFSNDSTMCYLHGKILNTEIYEKLSVEKTGYFPLYRAP